VAPQSVSFDHAADTYDATRALPEHVARKLTDALLAELDAVEARRVLEVGIGTGRIARPLAARGLRVTGVDIAPRMLARLREQLAQQHARPDLLLGDATALPLATGSFRATLGVHILHLVASIEDAAAELRRVLAPGGVFVRGIERGAGDNPWEPAWAKWNEIADRRRAVRRKRPSEDEINSALKAAGGSYRTRPYATDIDEMTPSFWLEEVRNRIGSSLWSFSDEDFAGVFSEFEPWFRGLFDDFERPQAQEMRYELDVWTFDGR
jgi:ubiquinone/menaquinone biosynthesis C-methylase UbiE